MDQASIFMPMGALVALTFLVLLLIPFYRFRAAFAGQVGPDDFKFGESGRVPGNVTIPNRNYMNLLELPMLFYIACMALFVTKRVSPLELDLAWAYVALRAAHSLVHLTANPVMIRLTLFALSNVVLGVVWVLFFIG